MFRKIILLITIAFAVVCYAFPCFILPFGEYKATLGSGDAKTEVSYQFGFDGKAVSKIGEIKTDYFYKLQGDSVILSLDDKFDDADMKLEIKSMYEIEAITTDVTNNIGQYIALGFGILAVLFVLSAPSKRR